MLCKICIIEKEVYKIILLLKTYDLQFQITNNKLTMDD